MSWRTDPRRNLVLLAVVFCVASSKVSFAATAGGHLTVTGTITGSLALTTAESGNRPSGHAANSPGKVSDIGCSRYVVTDGTIDRTYTTGVTVASAIPPARTIR
jgi:hypothetical protein